MLGKLPPCSKVDRLNDGGCLDPYGCEIPETLFPQIAKFPLDVQVEDIEAERVSLPTVNIGLKGGKPPSKAWKNKPASPDIRAHIKNNPSVFWKPFPSKRSAGIRSPYRNRRRDEQKNDAFAQDFGGRLSQPD